jgi:hypothetical protein
MAPATAQERHYQAQVAWLDAGRIELSLDLQGERRYELSGSVRTSGAMNRFFRWQGRFAATGTFESGQPRTDAYLLLTDDGKRRELVLAAGERTAIHRSGRESQELPQPPGTDLMSMTFLGTHCQDAVTVHDGEDPYRITLAGEAAEVLRQKAPYYSGPSKRCDYRFRGPRGRARRVSVWVAPVGERSWPVRIRIRVPLLPDGVLRLRTADAPVRVR